MKSYFTRFSLLIAILLLAKIAIASPLEGRVIGVADGDTVTVLDKSNTQFKIRLMGIDSPEKKQAFGNKAKQSLSDLLFNKQVTVEYSKKDKYGRTLGKILIDGVDANLAQVKTGMAWHYKKYQSEQADEDRRLYALAEEEARAGKIGLWVDEAAMPPWDWRKQEKSRNDRAAYLNFYLATGNSFQSVV